MYENRQVKVSFISSTQKLSKNGGKLNELNREIKNWGRGTKIINDVSAEATESRTQQT